MHSFIYGFDQKNPEACARALREKGIGAVVLGSFAPETLKALDGEGMKAYLCFGAHGMEKEGSRLSVDAAGAERIWFSSACPNDEALFVRRMERALHNAPEHRAFAGIFVDGARFASFASSEGTESFFTCFCPVCMEKMREMSLPADEIRRAVRFLMENRRVNEGDEALIRMWLRFREETVFSYFSRFAERVHALNPEYKAGAFVFAPSLSAFVGQTARAARALDIVSPMLYRAYPHESGPACLGHEWNAFLGLFASGAESVLCAAGVRDEEVLSYKKSADRLLSEGFSPERIEYETRMAKKGLSGDQLLWPILQIEDDRRSVSTAHAKQAGADAVGYFAFGQAEI